MQTILYVNPAGDVSGAENSLLTLIGALGDGYRPIMACPSPGRLSDRCREIGVPVFPIPFGAPKRSTLYSMLVMRPLQTLRLIGHIERIVKEQKVDLIHANSYLVGPASGIVARRFGIPVIWHIRDIRYGLKQKIVQHMAARYADRILVVSGAVKDTLGKQLDGRVHVVYNGVKPPEVTAEDRARIRKELGVGPDEFLVGNVGMLVPWKGQDLFVRMAHRVLGEVPNAKFAIVGAVWPQSLGFDQRVRMLAEELGIQDKIIFTGFRPDATSIIAGMDVYVHTALEPDPLPRSVLEAMAAGVPVVAPANGGILEAIVNGESGFLYRTADVEEVTVKVANLLKSRDMACRIGAIGSKHAKDYFSVEGHIRAVQNIYNSLLLEDGIE